MRKTQVLLAAAALALAETIAAAPRLMVHLSRCSGPELEGDQVLVIDLSESPEPQAELKKALEEHQLIAIRERTIESPRRPKQAIGKAAKTAGKERCDAVIILRKTQEKVAPSARPPMSRGTTTQASIGTGGTLQTLEVIFADPKPAPAEGEKKEGG